MVEKNIRSDTLLNMYSTRPDFLFGHFNENNFL